MSGKFKLNIGVEVIPSNLLPYDILNEETGELIVVHMIEKGNNIYVSERLFDALEKRFGELK